MARLIFVVYKDRVSNPSPSYWVDVAEKHSPDVEVEIRSIAQPAVLLRPRAVLLLYDDAFPLERPLRVEQ